MPENKTASGTVPDETAPKKKNMILEVTVNHYHKDGDVRPVTFSTDITVEDGQYLTVTSSKENLKE